MLNLQGVTIFKQKNNVAMSLLLEYYNFSNCVVFKGLVSDTNVTKS